MNRQESEGKEDALELLKSLLTDHFKVSCEVEVRCSQNITYTHITDKHTSPGF